MTDTTTPAHRPALVANLKPGDVIQIRSFDPNAISRSGRHFARTFAIEITTARGGEVIGYLLTTRGYAKDMPMRTAVLRDGGFRWGNQDHPCKRQRQV